MGTRVLIQLLGGIYVNVYACDGHMYMETLHVASSVLQIILPLFRKEDS